MHPKINEMKIYKTEGSLKRKGYDIREIIKRVNTEAKESYKNPFSNFALRDTFISPKYKNINKIKKHLFKNGKKSHKAKSLTLTEFVYFYNNDKLLKKNNKSFGKLNFEEIEKQKIFNRFMSINKVNNTDDNNFFKNMRENGFLKNLKTLERKNTLLSKKANINKKKNKSKDYLMNKNKSEKVFRINRMSNSINYLSIKYKLKDKNIQTLKENNNSLKRKNEIRIENDLKRSSFVFRNNKKYKLLTNKNRPKSSRLFQNIKKPICNDFEIINKENEKLLFKRNLNDNIKIKNRTYSDIHKILDIDSMEHNNSNSNNNSKYKNQCIKMFTLLSLKNNKIK